MRLVLTFSRLNAKAQRNKGRKVKNICYQAIIFDIPAANG
jgi:hypothetical protein